MKPLGGTVQHPALADEVVTEARAGGVPRGRCQADAATVERGDPCVVHPPCVGAHPHAGAVLQAHTGGQFQVVGGHQGGGVRAVGGQRQIRRSRLFGAVTAIGVVRHPPDRRAGAECEHGLGDARLPDGAGLQAPVCRWQSDAAVDGRPGRSATARRRRRHQHRARGRAVGRDAQGFVPGAAAGQHQRVAGAQVALHHPGQAFPGAGGVGRACRRGRGAAVVAVVAGLAVDMKHAPARRHDQWCGRTRRFRYPFQRQAGRGAQCPRGAYSFAVAQRQCLRCVVAAYGSGAGGGAGVQPARCRHWQRGGGWRQRCSGHSAGLGAIQPGATTAAAASGRAHSDQDRSDRAHERAPMCARLWVVLPKGAQVEGNEGRRHTVCMVLGLPSGYLNVKEVDLERYRCRLSRTRNCTGARSCAASATSC